MSEGTKTTDWRPIGTAPKDRPIWVYFDHDADLYHLGNGNLTAYGAHAEGGSPKTGKGQCVAVWGGGFEEDESGEGWGPWSSAPDWWFDAYSDMEIVVAPTHWRELPGDPQ